MTIYISKICILLFLAGAAIEVFAQANGRVLVVKTEPGAAIWIDGVKRGVTDETGTLEISPVRNGSRTLMVRADGFKQLSKRLLPTQRVSLKVTLVRTNNPAELAFQKAERLVAEDKEESIRLYRKAIRLRPRYAEAYIGLARALTGRDGVAALTAVKRAREIRRVFPEASAVEGRIYRAENEIDKAIESFDRAIREGNGFQPEAHTGLGLLFKSEAEGAGAAGDYEDEEYYYGEAAKSFEQALDQLSATEPVLYMLLGNVYEKSGEKEKAIAVYERFLRDFPVSNERSAVESFIVQIKKEMASNQ